MSEAEGTDQFEADRREWFLRQHAGMRFENTRVRRTSPRRWEDADGQLAEPFADDVAWPDRQAADLARWGFGEEPSWVARNRAETAAFRAKWGLR